jgi:hypothetical protein
MVTKSSKKGKVKVGKLRLNKETVKDLTAAERKRVKGGRKGRDVTDTCPSVDICPTLDDPCGAIRPR